MERWFAPRSRVGLTCRGPGGRPYHIRMSTPTDFLAVAVEAARLGAAELECWRKQFKVKEKSRADLVTDADHASQKVVREHLLAKLPQHAFLGEEECVGKKIDDPRPPV